MSEKKESDSSDQADYVSEKRRIIEKIYNNLRSLKRDSEPVDRGLLKEVVEQFFSDDDLVEELLRTLDLEEESDENSRRVLRLKDEFNQIEAFLSVSPQTDPEASTKDTASFIETTSEEDIGSLITKYSHITENSKTCASLRLKEKELETKAPKEEDSSKDLASSKDTQTKTFSSLDLELEIMEKIIRAQEILIVMYKAMLLCQRKKDVKEKMQQKRRKLEEKI